MTKKPTTKPKVFRGRLWSVGDSSYQFTGKWPFADGVDMRVEVRVVGEVKR